MSLSIEERLSALEKKVAELTAEPASDLIYRDGWESTVGMFADDPGYDEMVRLGAEYRESLRPPKHSVDSGH